MNIHNSHAVTNQQQIAREFGPISHITYCNNPCYNTILLWLTSHAALKPLGPVILNTQNSTFASLISFISVQLALLSDLAQVSPTALRLLSPVLLNTQNSTFTTLISPISVGDLAILHALLSNLSCI